MWREALLLAIGVLGIGIGLRCFLGRFVDQQVARQLKSHFSRGTRKRAAK